MFNYRTHKLKTLQYKPRTTYAAQVETIYKEDVHKSKHLDQIIRHKFNPCNFLLRLYLGIFLWREITESQMSKTSKTEANKETAREPAKCRQNLSKIEHTLSQSTCLLPFNPTYATAPAVPVAEAINPSISYVINSTHLSP